MKYDMTAIKYLEPTFLPLARNRKSYICPACGSGSGKNGSGMTSRDNEYWKCWSCGLSANKIELFKIQHSLSYEDACVGLLRFYGITPIALGETGRQSAVWLSQEEMDALSLYPGGMQFTLPNEEAKSLSVYELYDADPNLYFEFLVTRADEMIRKYNRILQACGSRNAPHAKMVYDYMGDRFDDSSYQKIKSELEQKIQVCEKLKKIYTKKIGRKEEREQKC